jgi:hypothetical protein
LTVNNDLDVTNDLIVLGQVGLGTNSPVFPVDIATGVNLQDDLTVDHVYIDSTAHIMDINNGDIRIWDTDNLILGTGNDCTMTHSGTNTSITNTTGNFTIDNQASTKDIILQLGTDTNATQLSVLNNSGTELFSVEGDGEVNIPERIGLNATPSSIVRLNIESASLNDTPIEVYRLTTSTVRGLFIGYSDNVSTKNKVVEIQTNGDVENLNNSYGGISDERVKDNIVNANSQTDDIKNMRFVNYKLKNNPNKTYLGVIGQELETSSPNLVKTREDGMKSVKYSILYLKCAKALQEQILITEELISRVEALEKLH